MNPWTGREYAIVKEYAHLGRHALAAALGRSPASVAVFASRHGISLRVDGSKKGKRMRKGLDPREKKAVEANRLCPECARRPVEDRKSGLCHPCYQTRLADAHRDFLEREEAEKNLQSARQEKHRARS